ncbi:MAG TPA: 50S ribosomal protein L4 [Flavobacteriales bacterium]|jgi:large subunit ribosomal protein L4|nr:50S ribosomal protein L4 [Flavobacteriales bacterium]
MELKVYDIKGNDTGRTVKLSEEIFGIEPNDHAIYMAVKQYLANQRQGTHKAKERGEVKGSTRKIKRQKGTGTARAGAIRNPLFKGGGRVFGPRPRSYSFKLNKKVKRLARKSALSTMMKNDNIMVVETFDFDTPKTKNFVDVLKSLKLDDKKSTFVFVNPNKNVYLSSRNLPKSKIINGLNLNTYAILNAGKLVFTEDAIPEIEAKF